MTKKEIVTVLNFGKSRILFISTKIPVGVSRFQAFLAIKPLLKGKLYWYALADAYTGSDNLFHYQGDIKIAFSSDHIGRNSLMTKKELIFLKNLPEKITIYRGMTEVEKRSKNYGVSWTLDRKVAEFYLTYYRNTSTKHLKKTVHKLVINKKDAIAYFSERNESEIIYVDKNPLNRV